MQSFAGKRERSHANIIKATKSAPPPKTRIKWGPGTPGLSGIPMMECPQKQEVKKDA